MTKASAPAGEVNTKKAPRGGGRQFLNKIMEKQLLDYLSKDLPENSLDNAVFAIDFQMASLAWSSKHGNTIALQRQKAHQHRARLVEILDDLIRALDDDQPLWNTKKLDWTALEKNLSILRASAAGELDIYKTGLHRRGRRPNESRDKLVSVVFSVYPHGKAKKSAGSNFEQTVELLFRFASCEVDDTHSVIIDALRRQPDPPFTVLSVA